MPRIYAHRALFLPIIPHLRLCKLLTLHDAAPKKGICRPLPWATWVPRRSGEFNDLQLLQYPLRPTCCQICCRFRTKSSPTQSLENAATPHRPPAASLSVTRGRSVSWLCAHLPAQSILRHLHRNSLVMQHGRVPATRKLASDVGNADSLCCGLECFKRLVGVNWTRSEAVQE
jgi:hypothetical protein